MTQAIGGAIAEYGDGLGDNIIAEVRQLIEAAVEGLRAEFKRELDALRSDFTAQATELFESVALISNESQRLRARLDEVVLAKKTRAKAAKAADALPLADASVAHGPNGS
jgi:hypothetical protein